MTDRQVLRTKIDKIIDRSEGTGTHTVFGFMIPGNVKAWANIPKTEADNEHKRHTGVKFALHY